MVAEKKEKKGLAKTVNPSLYIFSLLFAEFCCEELSVETCDVIN